MKQFSNRYIFIFSTVMVVAVASLLSLAATLFKPAQEKNLEIEKKRSMLESIGVSATRNDTEELYDKYITESFVLNYKGDPVEGVDAFTVVLRNEQKKKIEEQDLPVFRAFPDDGEKVLILPVEGKGLWGPIYGYVSLRSDLNTIYGVNFDHKGETPGLGAEINTTRFESMFTGKKLFENGKFVSIKVHKGGADPNDIHGVDAISGGTITSRGLEKMLFDCLSKYNDYFNKTRI
ncbi:MAG TPA: NADH:ubiquinone reductase (Na(+)-transporting) subunit C [Bacteroidales bacterium]|nr:NADH:ubiquinone reductase (Na(+)-transporting) subunit C [Bacteroidales bacterium]HQG63594.1 NADH:ubiquinone reductase (Na(+)-transporting) subunit C [Bacteroidales bacterium]HQK69018.1 NADH:ubiquinone reductase (Na(+)-transporting) subunit C [Bacteroidales bacterium]